MSARVEFTGDDLRAVALSLDALANMRCGGVMPGVSYERPRISHGDTSFTLEWVEPDADVDGHYVITDVD